ncbi:acetyl-CoA synthase subunit gamma [Dehalobacter sp. DCM]|uniref:mercury methylation corrinoid protein HgcA n=1 Tax=Dehalobacter sp. DCM TaxID=2907827 RepID=UPI003081C4B3|nr:acetyl-CoA synthase subunit gamma [Dehalobacter sp. DCM]
MEERSMIILPMLQTTCLTEYDLQDPIITGEIKTPAGLVPKVSTVLSRKDIIGAWKARWGINRMTYRINPGIYAIGDPDDASPIFVSANYKMSFDVLRRELNGMSAWILVLDTKGINVWCASGKGTFGTAEIVNKVNKTKLSQIVQHRTLILPQLGAPGTSAHKVLKQCGFKVVYGPVRASDIKDYMAAGMQASDDMRAVRFTMVDRFVLTPIELVGTLKRSLLIFGVLFMINLIRANAFGVVDFYAYVGAILMGCVLTPVLLPWIPGRAFAFKGWLLGLVWTLVVLGLSGWPAESALSIVRSIGYLLVLPSISAYLAMNFTGASTYTSISGVMKEMRKAVPPIIITSCLGAVMILMDSLFLL